MPDQLWTVILAAGAGRRLSALTGGVPKQFWRGLHGTSLLRQTIDRFIPLAPVSRTVVIVDAGHLNHVAAAGIAGGWPVLIVQPEDRGTAAGVFLALTPVLESAPDAVVVITPSDHGVRDDSGFRRGVIEAARQVRAGADVVLFGVEPASAQRDYGWISLSRACTARGFWPVKSFVEKPGDDVAAQLFGAGAVWNTMVMVARATAIRDLYVELLPNLAGVFADAMRLPSLERDAFLAAAYPTLPKYDFSRDLVARSQRMTAYVWPASLGWSDLGTPERLAEWQHRLGGNDLARYTGQEGEMRTNTRTDSSRGRELRRILESQRHRILDALRSTVREARADNAVGDGEVQDEAERSEADVQSEVEFALLQMQSETLARVEEALDRLDAGEFGMCAECGSEIPEARLKALPFAIRCRTCAQEREASSRSYGHPWTGWHMPV